MNRITVQIIFGFLMLLLVTHAGLSQTDETNADFQDLTIAISTPKTEFAQFEPIYINFMVSNETSRPIVGHTNVSFRYSLIRLIVTHNNQEKEFHSAALSTSLVNAVFVPRVIKPGEQEESQQLLHFSLDKIFPEPGVYDIQFILRNTPLKEEAKSNVITLRINPPMDQNRLAFEYIKTYGGPDQFFGSPIVMKDQQLRIKLEEFVSKFRDTAYGSYASFFLGLTYIDLGFSNADSSEQRTMYFKAAEYLKIASQHNFPLADQALIHLVETSMKLGDTESAKSYFRLLKKQFPLNEYTKTPPYQVLRQQEL